MPAIELEVGHEDAGRRLDWVLARRLPSLSRAQAKALIGEGGVRVDGRVAKKSLVLAAGDRITLARLPGPADFAARADPELPLVVLLETDGFVVVDKPAGVPSHPLAPEELGTLAGALVARYPEMRSVGYRKREPGIVHRLDTQTSGVMLAARDQRTFTRLRDGLRAGAIEKRYLARCVGTVAAPAVVDAAIASDPGNRRKVRVCADPRQIERLRAKPARTEILSSAAAAQGSLVEVRANHARRHQIRAHLASIGHPLLGDTLYGGPALPSVGHHLLHASFIRVGEVRVESADWEHAQDSATGTL